MLKRKDQWLPAPRVGKAARRSQHRGHYRYWPSLRVKAWMSWGIIGLITLSTVSCRLNITTQAQAAGPVVTITRSVQRSGPPATATAVPASPTATALPPTQTPTPLPSQPAVAAQPTRRPTATRPATVTPVFMPLSASAPTHIQAPTINLDAPVQPMGWTVVEQADGQQVSIWVVPDQAAGWHENSARPGQGSNVVLSGHHNLGSEVFRHLVDLKTGDEIILQADNLSYHYRVTDRFIVSENEASEAQRKQNAEWILPTIDERITLITCWPYTTNTHRLIVVAKPVSVTNLTSS